LNSSQAKKLQIINFLNVTGDIKNEVWIKSPFNPNEKTPSFKINTIKNIWFDHAQGFGGNVIDLVMQLNNCNLSQALKLLDTSNFSFSQAKNPILNNTLSPDKKNYQEIKEVKELNNLVLLNYLKSRKIDLEVAKEYLKEVYYSQKNKDYFALAFQNNSKGYETRNAYFKGCIGSKEITTIKGSNSKELSIFEGFMDFLSALTHFKLQQFKSDVIILNSVANNKKIEGLLYNNIYNKIYLFLDNDEAGNQAKEYFYGLNEKCLDCSNLYKNYKDFNEFLQKR
jgi:DNA primase